jgi:hypothetical protein
MSENERDRFLDDLLDESLRRYAQVEPRQGLESRLLASVPERAQRTAWPQWGWIAAATTAVVVLGVSANYFMRSRTVLAPSTVAQQSAPSPAVVTKGPAPTLVRPTPHPSVSRRKAGRIDRPERVGTGPRLATFPSEAPLFEQQRLLLLFVQHAPHEPPIARPLGTAPMEPLQIQPLSLARLEIDKSTKEN